MFLLIPAAATVAFLLTCALLDFLERSRRPLFIAVIFLVVGVGVYAASFVIDMIVEAHFGQLRGASIAWPCFTWSVIAWFALASCARRQSPLWARAATFWILSGVVAIASFVHLWNLITAILLLLGGIAYGFLIGPRSILKTRDSTATRTNGGVKCHTISASEKAKQR